MITGTSRPWRPLFHSLSLSTPVSSHLFTIALTFAFSCFFSMSNFSTSATATPTQLFAWTFFLMGSPFSSAAPTMRCTSSACLALTPSNKSGSLNSTATPTYSSLGSCTPSMRLYVAFSAGSDRLFLPSSTRMMPRASLSLTPSFIASSIDTRLRTRAARAAPMSEPAPRTLSIVASSPFCLRMWCVSTIAASVASAMALTAPTAAFMAALSFSLICPSAATHGSMNTRPMPLSFMTLIMYSTISSTTSSPSRDCLAKIILSSRPASRKSRPRMSSALMS